ncbi:MAG: MFS transporter [Dehalococcoidia bacterium]|nr:MFS transporter [Dehalococcoidia bacterium]
MIAHWPRRPRFYGWYIVGAALFAQFISAGTQAYVTGVFLKPMTTDLGWSRGEFSAVQSVSTFVMGTVGFVIGGTLDRRGPRRLMLAGTILCAAALALTSQVETAWQFYLVRGIAQTVGNALLGNLVVNVTVAKWFVVRRGMAISIASAGVSLGGVLMTPLAAWWISSYGWRSGWIMLSVVVLAIMIPASLVMRRSPEDHGLLPDGMTVEESTAYSAARHRASAVSEVQWTRSEAIRTHTIWLVIFAYGVANVGLGALLLHAIPFFTDSGFSRSTAAFLFGILAWAALVSKIGWGFLMDRYHARYLSASAFLTMAAAILVLIAVGHVGSVLLAVLVVLAYGLAMGGTVPLQETVWASYFGRAHLGEIRAVAMPFTIVFSAIGPVFAGEVFDRTGSYDAAFVAFALFSLLGFVLILLARPPQSPASLAADEPGLPAPVDQAASRVG